MKKKLIKVLIATAISASAVFGTVAIDGVSANATTMVTSSAHVSASGLHLRADASTHSKVLDTIPHNAEVNIISTGNTWDRVEYKGKVGFVSNQYLKDVHKANVQISDSALVTASSLNVRTGPGTGYSRIAGIPRGHRVEVIGRDGAWAKVKYNGRTGYVSNEYLMFSSSSITNSSSSSETSKHEDKVIGQAKITASGLNFRESARMNGKVIKILPHNSKVDIIAKGSDWTKIKCDGRTGYVYTKYLNFNLDQSTPKHEETDSSKNESNKQKVSDGKITASGLYIREQPSMSGKVISCLPRGTTVKVVEVKNGWAKLNYNGRTAYASAQYISTGGGSTANSGTVIDNNHNQNDWVSKLKVSQKTNQLITVQATGTRATVQLHEKDKDGKWKELFSTNGFIGYGGLSNPNTRHEGDGTTPTGVYDFGQVFGLKSNPGTKVDYTRLTPHHWWVGDSNSKYFNTLQDERVTGSQWSRDGGEAIADKPARYQYGVAINYNMNRHTAYKGWGIHLHCSDGLKHATAGCVGIPEYLMKEVLQQLEPGAKIVISTPDGIYNY